MVKELGADGCEVDLRSGHCLRPPSAVYGGTQLLGNSLGFSHMEQNWRFPIRVNRFEKAEL